MANIPKLGTSFGRPGAPSPETTHETHQQQAAPARTSRSRFTVKRNAQTDYSQSDAQGLVAPEKIPLKGVYRCRISKVGTTKAGALNFNVIVVMPNSPADGQERTFNCAPFPGAEDWKQKREIEKIAGFFQKSGLPESKWPAAASGKGKVPPVLDLFTVAVEYPYDDGTYVSVRVPVLIDVEFDQDPHKTDPLVSYIRWIKCSMTPGLIVAKLPQYAPPWVPKICNWPSKAGKYDSSVIVDAQEAAVQYAGLLDGEGIGQALE